MIRGSLVKLKGKCGKPNCACGHRSVREHIRYYLSFSDAGKTRMVYIPRRRLHSIEAGIHAWKIFKETGKEIAEINLAQALEEKD